MPEHLTAAEALAEIQWSLRTKVDKVEPGFYTRQQLQKEWGFGESATARYWREAVAAGKAEVKQFRIRTGSMIRNVPHIRFFAS